MRAIEIATALTQYEGRGAGTDAERRAAAGLARQVRSGRRRATLETFWCRPNRPLAHVWHTLVAIIGSLLAVHHGVLGAAIVLAALLCIVTDSLTGHSPGRRLTHERASQNVVSRAPERPGAAPPADDRSPQIRLIVTANYDAGRTGLVYRNWLRAPVAGLKRVADPLTPGWLGWLVIAMVWLLIVAILRHGGATGTLIGIAQLLPTAALVIALALLLELAGAPFGPGAADNGAGTAVAVALVQALDVAPPRSLDVELVLQGAGEAGMTGLTRHLRARRGELRSIDTIVLGIAASGAGRPHWWVSDGPLVPLPSDRHLRGLAGALGTAQPHRGRGTSPALPARVRGLHTLTIGCLDGRGLSPRSHQPGDTAAALDPQAIDAMLQFGLTLVDAIDADLARRKTSSTTGARPAQAAR